MKSIIFLMLLISFSCSNNKLNNANSSIEEIEINYRILPDTKYRITHEQNKFFNDVPTSIKSEFLIDAKSLDEITVTVLNSEQIIKDEELKKNVELILSKIDMSNDKSNHCYSNDGKSIKSKDNINKGANLKSIGAIWTWNNQGKLPNSKIRVGEIIEVVDSNNRKTANTVAKYKLDKILDNIAYLSYEEITKYNREDDRMKMKAKGDIKSIGTLEFDISNKFYRLITKEENASFKQQFKSPDEEKMKSMNEKMSMKSNLTTTISIVQ